MRETQRFIPALFVIAALALGASNPRRVAIGPAPPPMFRPECLGIASSSPGDSTIRFSIGAGISQPLPAGIPVAACSVRAQVQGVAYTMFRLKEWDPTALAPERHTIALRGMFLDPSISQLYDHVPAVTFYPPVISRSLPGVAERPRETTALQIGTTNYVFLSSTLAPIQAWYAADGPAELPVATGYTNDGWVAPLAGAHPVLAHSVCTVAPDLEALRVIQCVRRADSLLSVGSVEFLQRFRVPQAAEFRWAEVATLGSSEYIGAPALVTPTMPLPPPLGRLAIVDGGPDVLSGARPTPLVEAYFDPIPDPTAIVRTPKRLTNTWVSHSEIDRTIVLVPDHDYWLYLRSVANYPMYTRRLRPFESPALQTGVGELYARPDTTAAWSPLAQLVLDFKIVGRPVGPAPPPPLTGDGVELRLSPNPATASARIDWAGAVGPVIVEVFDARGRRVLRTEGGSAGTLTLQTDDTHRLRPGVYFVKLRGSDGRHTQRRLVLVR